MCTSLRLQRGFSLIEVLVAFSIMAMSVGLLYRILAGSARDVQVLDTQLQASVLAQSLLSMRDSVPPEGWVQAGSNGPFEWRVRSTPYSISSDVTSGLYAPEGSPSNPRLHEVHLVIEWPERALHKVWELKTLLPVIQVSPIPH